MHAHETGLDTHTRLVQDCEPTNDMLNVLLRQPQLIRRNTAVIIDDEQMMTNAGDLELSREPRNLLFHRL